MGFPGVKNFATGAVLTEGDLDGLMRQTIMPFDTTGDRDSDLTGILQEGMFAYINDDDAVYYYNGTAWIPYSTQWTSYTPSWTNLTPNSATVSAEYRYLQGDLRVTGKIVFAADTAVSGVIYQTIPDGQTASSVWKGGTGILDDDSDSSAAGFEGAIIGITPGGTTFAWVPCKSGGTAGTTTPWTWATDDQITWDFTVAVA